MAAAASFVTVDDNSVGQRLDNFLATLLKGVPKSHVYRIVRSGEVRVNKGRIDAAYRLKLDDIVRIPPVRTIEKTANPSIDEAFRAFSAGKAENTRGLALDILFEDDALLAINKPAGMAVHGGSGISFGVIEALRALRPEAKFIELVHRIDRPARNAAWRNFATSRKTLQRIGERPLARRTPPHSHQAHETGDRERRTAGLG